MLLDALRRETRPLHDRLDRHPLLVRLLARDLGAGEYARILRAFLAVYRPVEAALARSPLPADWTPRYKAPLLARDLVSLGEDTNTVEDCPDVPNSFTLDGACGVLYVLEGAAHGARVIARQLARSLALDPANGGAFFGSAGDDLDERWRALGRVLSRPESADAIAAARLVFTALERHL